ncbi:MAG: hypothetical protein AAGE98_19855 [Actinomycetota bacterium]
MPPTTLTAMPSPTALPRSRDELVALIEQHQAAVLAEGIASHADRALWAAAGVTEPPSLRLIAGDADIGDDAADPWFDAPQDWDSFWSGDR